MDDGQSVNEIEQIVASVRASPRYRSVCASTIRRIATEEWSKRTSPKLSLKRALRKAIKATRSRLHQAYGAYESPVDYERGYRSLETAYADGAPQAIRSACQRILSLHTSTRERLPILDRFYTELFAHTGVPRTLLDLACGLNPLSLPWMGLGDGSEYYAYDIDVERVAFLVRYFFLAKVLAHVRLQDVICDLPTKRADVALLMKSSTCLERQREGSTLALLDVLDVRHAVVTFPVKSLGRREKGMPGHYTRTFLAMLSDRPWAVTQLDFATELAFIVHKG